MSQCPKKSKLAKLKKVLLTKGAVIIYWCGSTGKGVENSSASKLRGDKISECCFVLSYADMLQRA